MSTPFPAYTTPNVSNLSLTLSLSLTLAVAELRKRLDHIISLLLHDAQLLLHKQQQIEGGVYIQ